MIYFCQKGKKKKWGVTVLTTVSNKKATLVKFRSGKRTQFNITNITKLTFAADVFF